MKIQMIFDLILMRYQLFDDKNGYNYCYNRFETRFENLLELIICYFGIKFSIFVQSV